MATIDGLLSDLQSQAESALRTARETTSRISNGQVPTLGNTGLQYTFSPPDIGKPPSFGDFLTSDTTGSTIQFLDAQGDKFIDKYFPEINACLKTSPEEWLCGIISGADPFGDSKALVDLIWHEARDREYRTRNSEIEQLNATFSGRGFSLPPGALISSITQAEVRASDAIGDANRQQSIKMSELKVQLLQFAVQEAVQLKLGVISALANFYQQWISLPERDIELAKAKAQLYATQESALSDYYRVQIAFEELRLKAADLKMEGGFAIDRNKIAVSQGTNAASALGNAVRAFGDVASAASNAQSALVADLTGGKA